MRPSPITKVLHKEREREAPVINVKRNSKRRFVIQRSWHFLALCPPSPTSLYRALKGRQTQGGGAYKDEHGWPYVNLHHCRSGPGRLSGLMSADLTHNKGLSHDGAKSVWTHFNFPSAHVDLDGWSWQKRSDPWQSRYRPIHLTLKKRKGKAISPGAKLESHEGCCAVCSDSPQGMAWDGYFSSCDAFEMRDLRLLCK